jgi:MFS family permease
MQLVTQSWLVYRLTRSEWLLGVTSFCTQVPVFALGPLGGLAADRYSRLKLVRLTQTLMMTQALTLALLTLTGKIQVWQVLALALAQGIINAFDMPGRQSLIIQLSGKEDLLNAISLNYAMFNAARVVGPTLAGVLVARLGEGFCFLLNGLSFLALPACLSAVRLPQSQTRAPCSPWADLVDGFRYTHRAPLVRALLALLAAACICFMPVQVLMPVFAEDIFHRGSQGLGVLMGALGIGAVIGTLVLAKRAQTSGLSEVVFFSALGLATGLVLFSISPYFSLSLAIMPVIGFSVMRQNASANTLIQVSIPDEYRGRIMALYSMTVVGISPFGSLAAGALAERFGARLTVLLAGLLCLMAATLFHLRCPRSAPEPAPKHD